MRVCKSLLLNTLAIGSWTAQNWQQETTGDTDTDEVNDPEDGMVLENNQDEVTVSAPKKTRKSTETENLEDFFSTLPKVESHYCRKSSAKLYIEPNWSSKRELYSFLQK